MSDLESMASYIVRGRLFGAKDESQAMSLMLLAQAEGLHPMTAIQDFDIVQGRPARKTHSILARFQAAGGKVAWEEITAIRACGTFSHPSGGSLKVEWTFEQAKKAGLTGKDNWKNYPQAMLRARCIAEGVRAVYPGAIGGMLTVEEAQDHAPSQPRDMGAAQIVDEVDVESLLTDGLTTTTDADALAFWRLHTKNIKDPAKNKRFKDAMAAHRAELQAREAADAIPALPPADPVPVDYQPGAEG
jgi:hypothetical protein